LDKIILFKERAAWWKYTGVIALGVLELVVGLVMVISLAHTGIGALIGMGILIEGINDIFYGATSGISGNFSFKENMVQKIIGVLVTVATLGIYTGISANKIGWQKALLCGFDPFTSQSVKEIRKTGSKKFLLKPLSKLLVKSRYLLYNFSVNSIIRKLYQEKWMIEIEEKYLKDILNKQFLTIRDRLERENILKRQKLAYFLDKKLKNENENEYGD